MTRIPKMGIIRNNWKDGISGGTTNNFSSKIRSQLPPVPLYIRKEFKIPAE